MELKPARSRSVHPASNKKTDVIAKYMNKRPLFSGKAVMLYHVQVILMGNNAAEEY